MARTARSKEGRFLDMSVALSIPGHDHPKAGEVSLEEIRQVMGECRLCPLCETRTNIVFGQGDAHARVVIIGEAPGANEDERGIPFCGRSGDLLDRMLSEEVGISRSEVFIANILKCRPPANRDPKPEEVEVCSPYLREQIRSIWPDYILTMGNPSTRFILRTEAGITRLRGSFHQTGHFMVLPTYHPAAVLRDPRKMAEFSSDFRLLGAVLRGETTPQEHMMGC